MNLWYYKTQDSNLFRGRPLEAGNGYNVPLPDQDPGYKNERSPMKTLIKLHAYNLQTFMSQHLLQQNIPKTYNHRRRKGRLGKERGI